MVDYTDAINVVTNLHQNAGTSLAPDKSPDEAARAFELSSATGVPAEHIAPDIDGFETQHKQALGQSIIDNNAHILDFINSHPLHGQLINDDLGNLDKFSRSFRKLTELDPISNFSRGFGEGFGKQGFGEWREAMPEEWRRIYDSGRYPISSALWNLLGGSLEFSQRLFGATLSGVERAAQPLLGEQAARDLAGMAELELIKPEHHMEAGLPQPKEAEGAETVDLGRREFLKGAGAAAAAAAMPKLPKAPGRLESIEPAWWTARERTAGPMTPEFGQQLQGLLQEAETVRPWAEAGEVPPEGVSGVVDKGREEQAKLEQDQIKEALDDAKATNLKERSPEKFGEFMDSHPAGTISIDKAGIEAQPEAFKWIPPERLQSPLSTVEVPAKDFIANFDPELWPEVKDFVSKSGTSVEEAKQVIAYHGSLDVMHELDPEQTRLQRGMFFSHEPEGASKFALDQATDSDPMMIIGDDDPEQIKRWVSDTLGEQKGKEIGAGIDQFHALGKQAEGLEFEDPRYLELQRQWTDISNRVTKDLRSATAATLGRPNVTKAKLDLGRTYEFDFGGRFDWDKEREAIDYALANGYDSVTFTGAGDFGKFYSVFRKEQIGRPLERKVLQRGRSGRPIRTEPLPPTDPLVETIRRAAGLEALPEEAPAPSGEVFERAKAYGRTEKEYAKIQQLMAEQDAADVAYAKRKADQAAERANSAEWKAEETKIRPEIEAEVRSRPEVAAYQFLAKGEYAGQKVPRRLKIAREFLSPEQADAISPFVADRGVHPDGIANLFGFSDGNSLVDALATVERQTATGRGDVVKRLTDSEVARQLEAKLGPSAAERLDAARDQALSTTTMELLAERTLALGQRAGAELPLSKADMDRGASRFLAEERFGSLTTDKLLGEAGKAGRRVEQAMTAGDWIEAFRQQQLHYSLSAMAKEFRGIDKELRRFDRQAKVFSKRPTPEDPLIGGVRPEYTNWVQDILMRVGRSVLRSVQDLQQEIAAGEYTNLQDFVIGKSMMGHDVYMPDFLLDPAFRKPIEDMTVGEARQTMKAVRSLVEVGRAERKATIGTEKMDLIDARQQAIDQIAKSQGGEPTAVAPANPIRATGRWVLARSMQMESLLNRFDLGNPRGFFNRGIFRPLAEAANGEAKMDREIAAQIRAVKYKGNLNESVPNTLFKDPNSTTTDAKGEIDWDNARPYSFTRKNLLAVMHNVGNADNIMRLAEGYGVKPEEILQWVNTVATPEDWRYVSEFGKIFERLKTTSDEMYRRLTGVAPESIELVPIQTPSGPVDGWYHPIIHDPQYRGRHLPTGEKLFDDYYVQAGSPNGYTKARTGYRGPLSLELDMVAQRIKQEIHDIHFREPVIEASKILLDRSVQTAVDRYYGKAFGDELRPFIEDVANIANHDSGPSANASRVIEWFRQNTIGSLVGLNIRTVQKHTLTAAINSMTEVGAENFLREFGSLFSQGERAGESNWRFAMTKSEELQRRHQNYQEMVRGAYGSAVEATGYGPVGTLRQTVLRLGTAPVAMGDLLSSVPTWLAAYKDQIAKGLPEGDAVAFADRAVRRAHGSSAITSRPGVMRGGPLAQTFASLYGFFSHILQRQYEMAWQAKLSLGQATRAEMETAMGKKPDLLTGLFSYVLAPAIVEELVTPYTNEEKDSWGMKAAKTLAFGLSSSWIGVRDVVHAAITNGDVSLGILNTPAKDIQTFIADLRKGEVAMDRAHAGKTIRHATTALGVLSGLSNTEMGNIAEYLYDLNTGKQSPRDLSDWYRGLTKGEQRPRSGPDLIEKGLVAAGGHYSQRKR